MKAIIAVNNLGYIGLKNKLPWSCKKDLQLFKEITSNKDLRMLVGFKTWQTLPNVVKQRGVTLDMRGELHHSHYPKIGENQEIPYICIGGKKTYEKYCHLFTELHISHINDNTVGDTMFPDLKNLNPECKIINHYFEPDETTKD